MKTISLIFSLFFLYFAMASVALVNQLDKLTERPTTNISEYLKSQDDKIATQSALIANQQERIDNMSQEMSEDYQIFILFQDKLSQSEVDQTWKEYNNGICLEYHDKQYCKGTNGN